MGEAGGRARVGGGARTQTELGGRLREIAGQAVKEGAGPISSAGK